MAVARTLPSLRMLLGVTEILKGNVAIRDDGVKLPYL
jgi:hypothetical protein